MRALHVVVIVDRLNIIRVLISDLTLTHATCTCACVFPLQPSGLYYYLESKETPPEDTDDIDRLAIRDNLKLAAVRYEHEYSTCAYFTSKLYEYCTVLVS